MRLIFIVLILFFLPPMLTLEQATEAKIKQLDWLFQLQVRAWFALCKRILGLTMIITSGRRTAAEQNAQHAADSRNPAHVAGKLNDHEAGLAVDVNAQKNGVLVLRKASTRGDWAPVVRLAKLCGLAWGGDFKTYYDSVHFYHAR